jgi:hypothetical protein
VILLTLSAVSAMPAVSQASPVGVPTATGGGHPADSPPPPPVVDPIDTGGARHPHKGAARTAKGTIVSVDTASSSVVVHPAKGADVVLKVNEKTRYVPKGRTWQDVTLGARVSVTYRRDGTDNWALTIHVWPADTGGSPAKTGTA